MAAVLVADGAVLSHRSAAALWGIRRNHLDGRQITVPRAVKRRARLEIHQAWVKPDEITTHNGIAVTTPARTLLDLAAVVSPHHLERAATEAEIRRLGSPTSLNALVARYPTTPGHQAVRSSSSRPRRITRAELEVAFSPSSTQRSAPPAINAIVAADRGRLPSGATGADRRARRLRHHGTRRRSRRPRTRPRSTPPAGGSCASPGRCRRPSAAEPAPPDAGDLSP